MWKSNKTVSCVKRIYVRGCSVFLSRMEFKSFCINTFLVIFRNQVKGGG